MPIAEDSFKSEQALDMAVADLKSLHASLCKEDSPQSLIAAELLRRDMQAIAEASARVKQTLSDIRKAFPSPSTQEDAPPLESKLFPAKQGSE